MSIKILKSPNYNYIFNRETGFFMRWGETPEDDPQYSPIGPELADIEISTVCHRECSHCYKSNTSHGQNMSLDTYKTVLNKLPDTLCQVALGIGSIDAHPELENILRYTREQGYIPNITVNGDRINKHHYKMLASLCGAVSVSNYDKDVCYEVVFQLNRWKRIVGGATLKQVNIHQLLSTETFDNCWTVLQDMQDDERLKNLNSTVFLLLKPKGDRNTLTPLKNSSAYRELIQYALNHRLPVGFDSCTAASFLKAVKDRPDYEQLKQVAEPCESTCFSIYVDVLGRAYPCSFCEDVEGIEPVNLLDVQDFITEVWNEKMCRDFRGKLIESHKETGCRRCPVYDLEIGE